MKKFMKTTIVWLALSAVIFCACSEEENPPDYNMTGTYKFTNSGGECTWVFKADKSYQVSGYGITGTKTGTWSSSGNDVTISYESGSISGKEVFTVKESGNQLTLTLKDGSVSNLLVSLGLAAKSVTLTKTGDGTTAKDTAVTFSGVTADGSTAQTTTRLTLTFSQAITGLSADDITLSGVSVTKGTLSNSGSTYILPVSGFTAGGSLSVAAAKTGYAISGSPKTVTIYYFDGGRSVSIEMVQISGGTFTMGSPNTESGRDSGETQHSVTLSGFSMSKYQVTQEQYQAKIGSNPSSFTSAVDGESGTPGKLPVECVSWYDAIVFCNKLSAAKGLSPVYRISGSTDPAVWGTVPTSYEDPKRTTWDAVEMVAGSNGYRLPTEAEWEYACRAGTTTAYNNENNDYTNTASVGAVGWYSENNGYKTHQVGLKEANAWGLYDMHGNVWEWCWDWYGSDYYSSSPTNDPTGPESGTFRVLRGGGYYNNAITMRSAYRSYYRPDYGGVSMGFRLVRSF